LFTITKKVTLTGSFVFTLCCTVSNMYPKAPLSECRLSIFLMRSQDYKTVRRLYRRGDSSEITSCLFTVPFVLTTHYGSLQPHVVFCIQILDHYIDWTL